MTVTAFTGAVPRVQRRIPRSAEAFHRNPLREGVGTGYARVFHARCGFASIGIAEAVLLSRP